MTDAEVLATFMESKPELRDCLYNKCISPCRYWRLASFNGGQRKWVPNIPSSLDSLVEIESRLFGTSLNRYVESLCEQVGNGDLWHASAAQKIAALATVLRPLAEKSA